MAYVEHRERSKGDRYRGFYKDADGRYKSAGTYDTEERALSVAQEAEKRAAALISGAVGGLDPVTRATRTVEEYAPIFLRHHRVEGNTKDIYEDTLRLHIIPFLAKVRLAETDRTVARNYFTALEEAGRTPNRIRQAKVVVQAMFTMAVFDGYLDSNPFHDVKTPKVPGRRAIKVATTEQYLKIRDCLPTPRGEAVLHPARVQRRPNLRGNRTTATRSRLWTPEDGPPMVVEPLEGGSLTRSPLRRPPHAQRARGWSAGKGGRAATAGADGRPTAGRSAGMAAGLRRRAAADRGAMSCEPVKAMLERGLGGEVTAHLET